MTIYLGFFAMLLTGCGERYCCDADISPTFTELESDIFGVSSLPSLHHGGGTGGLLLNGEDDFDRLVNVESTVVGRRSIGRSVTLQPVI